MDKLEEMYVFLHLRQARHLKDRNLLFCFTFLHLIWFHCFLEFDRVASHALFSSEEAHL